MAAPVDSITELDLQAYVDDQLPVLRRIEVEAQLSRNPSLAARVVSDLKARCDLRIALSEAPRLERLSTGNAARRLERGLIHGRRVRLRHIRRAAAVAMFLAVGWFAHAQLGGLKISQVVASPRVPAYVADAVIAYRTMQLRATMQSQHKDPDYDPEEIRSAAAIIMPKMPKAWKVDDVQMFPSKFGPSIETTIRDNELGMMALFAVRTGTSQISPVTISKKADVQVAHWQIGEVAYALSAQTDAHTLDQAATRLAKTLY